MSRPGRAVLANMRAAAEARKPGHAERIKLERSLREQAHRETIERFGGFTPENAGEAIKWQETRIRELLASGITL